MLNRSLTFLLLFTVACYPIEAGEFPAVERRLTLSYDFGGHGTTKWQHGVLISIGVDASSVVVHDPVQNSTRIVRLSLPDVSRLDIHDAAIHSDGTIAVATSAFGGGAVQSPLIVWVSPTNQVERVVRSASFGVMKLCFAPDGSLWVAGREFGPDFETIPGHNVLRHFSANGILEGAVLPENSFIGTVKPQHPATGGYLTASQDRIGFYSASAAEWIELDFSGKILGRWPGVWPRAEFVTGAVITPSGKVFVGTQVSRRDAPTSVPQIIYELDKKNSKWVPLSTNGPRFLFGAEGSIGIVGQKPPYLDFVRLE